MKKLLLLLVACAVICSGCEPAKTAKISIGKIDTAVLVQDNPEYLELSKAYIDEQTKFRKGLFEKMKAVSKNKEKLKKIQAEGLKKQKEIDAKWSKKTADFLAAQHESIRERAKGIAERKNIDIVIIDSKEYPTVEWGGVDMTPDMKLSLSQDKG